MTIKQAAISLNTLNKTIRELPDCALKHQLQAHVEEMCQDMLKQCVRRNQANNYKFHLRITSQSPHIDIEQLDHYFITT